MPWRLTVSNTAFGTPIRYGIGAHRISFIVNGRIGMNMCCHTIGYSRAFAACTQHDKLSKRCDVNMIRRSASIAANNAIIFFGTTKL